MRDVRLKAYDMLGGLLNRLVTDRHIEPYEWESCVAEKPFDQRLSMQENLISPSDPNCAGVICLLGERIGFPLQEFDISAVPGWDDWSDPTRTYRVVYPWPEAKGEQLALVKQGAFSLTGTVYEALAALGTGKPVHIAYFADRPVTPDDYDVRLNSRMWQMQMLKQIAASEKQEEWLRTEYAVQIRGVTNFLNALNKRSRYLYVHRTTTEALEAIQLFVEREFGPDYLIEDNPYRFLDFYDIIDGEDLPGREGKTKDAVKELRSRIAQPNAAPAIMRISGESGCGKTSFMRAGVLAALNRRSELDRYSVAAIRPTDFHDENGKPDRQLLARLLSIIMREADLELSHTAVERVARLGPSPRAAQLAVDVLIEALAADKDDTTAAIVMGLDQFEEILDDLAATDRRRHAAGWVPLLNFVELAAKSNRFGFVYTLESSRADVFERAPLPDIFRRAHEVRLGNPSDAFLEAIITQPFQRAGYRLAPRIVNTLLASYKNYKPEGHASPLPLLALKLSHLFDFVQSLPHARSRQTSGDGLQLHFEDSDVEISYDVLKEELRLDDEIEELANAAWGLHEMPEGEALDDLIDNLNPFLQPLVALSGSDFDDITLQTVSDSPFVDLDERLKAFEDVRLVIRENGRRRLVHEAVIRQWPLAAEWLERKREYLKDEARLRDDANYWRRKGETPALVPEDEEAIDIAAAVLRNYIQEWPRSDPADLTPSDQNLFNFCKAVFGKSTTPRRADTRHFRKAYLHIHTAASYGMTDLVRRFIDEDPECLELPSHIGSTPLDHAAWACATTTRLLIDKEANPVHFDNEGWSTLSRAIWQKDADIFRILQPYYRTANSLEAPRGMSLLHVAAWRGAVDMAATLLATVEDVDPMKEDDHRRTPLDYAAMFNQAEAFSFFLSYCDVAHRAKDRSTVLHYAAANGAEKIVDEILFLPEFYDLVDATDAHGNTALMTAAWYRQARVVERLAEVIDPNRQNERQGPHHGWTALHFAIQGPPTMKHETRVSRQQALRTVRALLAAPDINPTIKTGDGKEPIALATALPPVRRELISDPSFGWSEQLFDGSTPLNYVIKAKDRPAVERMLHLSDLDVELLSANGEYALSLLITHDMEDLALRLFEEGRVDPWHVTGAKDIGLSAALSADHEPLIAAYLEQVPEAPDRTQRRSLSQGARVAFLTGKSRALLERLVELGADPEQPLSEQGWTLFHYAALVGNLAAFDRLARDHAAPFRRDAWGRTPADVAPDHVRALFEVRLNDVEEEPFVPAQAPSSGPAQSSNSKASEQLFACARLGDMEGIAALLADPTVDPTVRDDWGRSPADHAPDALREEIANLLRRAAADH